ncbi:MAG TPA: hypothetical protein VMF64_02155 [Steroidobacteraceae bacterium]|nr:hypothetical protein [Steroidobacteraceae bacterium]
MSAKTLLALAALLCCAPLAAQQSAPDRVRRFAALPAWSGLWEGEAAADTRSDAFDRQIQQALAHPENIPTVAPPGVLAPAETFMISRSQLMQEPPYTPQWHRRYEEFRRKIQMTSASVVNPGSIMACTWDFPEIMDNPFDTLFQIFVTPEETLLLFANGQARHLYTDRPHPKPEDLWPSDLGNSVGRWQGDTLIIDTIQRRPGPFLRVPFVLSPDLSDKARFTERLHMTGPDSLQDDMTIEDPERLVHPWTVALKFQRAKGLDRLIPTDCSENNRFHVVNGQMTIESH